jgi:hypothetical protein
MRKDKVKSEAGVDGKKPELAIENAMVSNLEATSLLETKVSNLEAIMSELLKPGMKSAEKKEDKKEKEMSVVETAICLDIKRKHLLADRIQLIMEGLV